MALNPDFKKFLTPEVELQWPRLDQPYRYDPNESRTEPCSATATGAGWSCGFVMEKDDAKTFYKDLKAHYEECAGRNKKLPKFSDVFSMKKDKEAGTVSFTARRRAMSNEGRANKPPKVVGLDLQSLEDMAIWSGSKGKLRVIAFPATNPQDKSGGISLLLDVVQVTEAHYGSEENLEEDFGPAKVPDLEDFDNSGDDDDMEF